MGCGASSTTRQGKERLVVQQDAIGTSASSKGTPTRGTSPALYVVTEEGSKSYPLSASEGMTFHASSPVVEEAPAPLSPAVGDDSLTVPAAGGLQRLSIDTARSSLASYGTMSSGLSGRKAGSQRSKTHSLGDSHARDSQVRGEVRRLSKNSSRSKASSILHNTAARELLKNPTTTKLPDGSRVLDSFRDVFRKLEKGDGSGVVTPSKLEAALQDWAMLLPDAARTRIAFVVTGIFKQLDADGYGAISWEQFEEWLGRFEADIGEDDEEALAELFDLCDTNGSGTIHAQELLDVLLLIANARSQDGLQQALTPQVAEAIVRDLDSKGTGGIELSDFTEVVHSFWAKKSRQGTTRNSTTGDGPPHLVLNFDINQTVLMIDSCTGADTAKLCSTVIANAAWGEIQQDASGKPIGWSLKHPEVLTYAPAEGLHTYKEYVDLVNPLITDAKGEMNRAHDKKVKANRRLLLWKFTEPGQPGETLRPKLLEMQASLHLPEHVKGTKEASAAGLDGDCYCLLPSFLRMVRELKRQGRSFTLFFRTFGSDMEVVLRELNALCEGRHPLFLKEDPVILDGSDGQPDYRMALSTEGCGTFFRNPLEDTFALIMGTIDQPELKEDHSLAFYDGRKDIEITKGFHEVCSKIMEFGGRQSTFGLRDSYLGWSVVGSTSVGGKPFFLGDLNDPSRHSIFFDDNITATDPRIVDPIDPHHWPRRFCSSQLNGVHLIQAQPVESITNANYFLDCIRNCEEARRAKLERWELAQRLLGNLAEVRRVLGMLVAEPEAEDTVSHMPTISYRPWMELAVVQLSSKATTFDDMEEAPVDLRKSGPKNSKTAPCLFEPRRVDPKASPVAER